MVAKIDATIEKTVKVIKSMDAYQRVGRYKIVPAVVVNMLLDSRAMAERAKLSYRTRRLLVEQLERARSSLVGKVVEVLSEGGAVDQLAPCNLNVKSKIPAIRWSEGAVRALLAHLGDTVTYEDAIRIAAEAGKLGQPKLSLEQLDWDDAEESTRAAS